MADKTWEERFDKFYDNWFTESPQKHDYLDKEIKAFIRQLLTSQKEMMVDMLNNLEPRVMGEDSPSGGWLVIYKDDLDNIIKKIEEEK